MKRYFLTLILSGIIFQFFGQAGKNIVYERVYLQTDKQLYLSGEQIQLKLFTVDAERIPVVFSKIAYAELVDDTIARIQIKVSLINGIGAGRMELPTDLPTGIYRLIAYTQYMRNESVEVFFEKNICVVNTFQSGYYPNEAYLGNDVQGAGNDVQGTRNGMQGVVLRPDKTTYSTREHGELTVSGLPDNIHTLSVSISGNEQIIDNKTIQLFIPHKPTTFSGECLPEYEGHILTGKVIDNQTGKVIDNQTRITLFNNPSFTTGLAFPGNKIRFFTGQKTKTGDVRFFTSGIAGTKNVATVIYNADEKYRVEIISPYITHYAPTNRPILRIDSSFYKQILVRSVALQILHYFANDSENTHIIQASNFKTIPTNSYLLEEYTRFTTMEDVFSEFIINARFRRKNGKWELSVLVKKGTSANFSTNPLVLLDGVPISNHELIYNYDPLLVEQINIYNDIFHFGDQTFEGIIELKTYRGQVQDINFGKETQIIPYEGPQLYHQQFNPDYAIVKNRTNRMPDSRHTLLWNPYLQTERKSVVSIPFDTSDLLGDYQATIEGITKTGEIIYSTIFLKVEK